MMKLVEQLFEKALWNSRFVVLLAVISSLFTAFAMFYMATVDTLKRRALTQQVSAITIRAHEIGLSTGIWRLLFCNHKITQGPTRANGIKRIAGD